MHELFQEIQCYDEWFDELGKSCGPRTQVFFTAIVGYYREHLDRVQTRRSVLFVCSEAFQNLANLLPRAELN